MIYDVIPENLTMPSSENRITWTFLTSVHVFKTSASEAYTNGKEKIMTIYCFGKIQEKRNIARFRVIDRSIPILIHLN